MVSFCCEDFFIGDSWIAAVCSGHEYQSNEANHTKGEEVVSTYDTTHIIVFLDSYCTICEYSLSTPPFFVLDETQTAPAVCLLAVQPIFCIVLK